MCATIERKSFKKCSSWEPRTYCLLRQLCVTIGKSIKSFKPYSSWESVSESALENPAASYKTPVWELNTETHQWEVGPSQIHNFWWFLHTVKRSSSHSKLLRRDSPISVETSLFCFNEWRRKGKIWTYSEPDTTTKCLIKSVTHWGRHRIAKPDNTCLALSSSGLFSASYNYGTTLSMNRRRNKVSS